MRCSRSSSAPGKEREALLPQGQFRLAAIIPQRPAWTLAGIAQQHSTAMHVARVSGQFLWKANASCTLPAKQSGQPKEIHGSRVGSQAGRPMVSVVTRRIQAWLPMAFVVTRGSQAHQLVGHYAGTSSDVLQHISQCSTTPPVGWSSKGRYCMAAHHRRRTQALQVACLTSQEQQEMQACTQTSRLPGLACCGG